jgi:cytosine/adenosine deaminase-related metal-dependent hydrolase
LLVRIRDEAERWQTSIQTHLLETAHQRRASFKNGAGEVQRLAALGFLSPLLSCAHCVWVDDEDIDLLAGRGTTVVHNASSNLRLGSGLAPVSRMLERGVNVALGLDSNGLNDDGDMLQEMRLAANLQRGPGISSTWPTSRQILSMATRNGARALTLDQDVGVLEKGKKADLILLRLDVIEQPYVDPQHDAIDTLVYRAKAKHVDTVMIDGKLVMEQGNLLSIDKEAVVGELQSQLKAARYESMAWLRELKPYADRLYNAESGWRTKGSLYESDRN